MSAREHDEAAELRLSAAVSAAREQWPDRDALARVRQGVASSVGSPLPASGVQARLLRRSLRGAWLRGGGSLALMIGAGYAAFRLHAGVAPEPALAVTAPVVHAQAAVPANSGIAPALRGGASSPPRVLPAAALGSVAAEPAPPAPARIEPRRKTARWHSRVPVAATPAAAATPSDPEAELALLRRALASLPHHPKQSLELVAEHERDYAQGIFGQEREVIAIDALLALQQTSAAEARARAFLARYPRSAHAPRIRTLLNGTDGAPAQMALEQGVR